MRAENQSSAFARLNLADLGSWQLLPALERGVQSVALVPHEGALYRVGGMVAENAAGQAMELRSLAEFARFEPASGTWTALTPLPGGRSSHAAAAVGSRVFVVGGWDVAGQLGRKSTFCSATWVFDLEHPEAGWSSLATPFRRRGLGLAALEGTLVAVGGMDDDGDTTGRVDVLDVESGEWSRGPDFPDMGFGVSAAVSHGDVYACGSTGRVWRWTPGDERWVECAQLQFPRIFHQLVALDSGDLVAVGGVTQEEQVRAVEIVHAGSSHVGAVSGRALLPTPAKAKNRQATMLIGDELFLFGGNRSLGQHDFAPENFLDEGWKLDLRSLEWAPAAAFPAHRQTVRTASDDGKRIFGVGGFGHDGTRLRSFSEAFVYDVEGDRWSACTGLPATLTQFGLVAHGNALWALGGLSYVDEREDGEDFVHPLAVLRKDLAEGDDAPFADSGIALPRPRRAFGCAELDGKVYLIGGLADGFEAVEPCDVLDLETRTWSSIPQPHAARISPELVELDGRLYLAGGSARGADCKSRPERSLEVFDPRTGAWSVLVEELPIQPAQMQLFAHRGRLLAVSTQHAGAGVAELVWIDARPATQVAALPVPASAPRGELR
jgi:hypothetical protein